MRHKVNEKSCHITACISLDKISSNDGFTLLEFLLAITILSSLFLVATRFIGNICSDLFISFDKIECAIARTRMLQFIMDDLFSINEPATLQRECETYLVQREQRVSAYIFDKNTKRLHRIVLTKPSEYTNDLTVDDRTVLFDFIEEFSMDMRDDTGCVHVHSKFTGEKQTSENIIIHQP
jgi:prepilin-type N-terminal cleavage/methylation domain-containing protein